MIINADSCTDSGAEPCSVNIRYSMHPSERWRILVPQSDRIHSESNGQKWSLLMWVPELFLWQNCYCWTLHNRYRALWKEKFKMATCLLAPSSIGCYGKEKALSLIRYTPGTRYEGGDLSCGTVVCLRGGMRGRFFFYSFEPSEPHILFKYTDLLWFAFVYKIKIKIFLFLRRILLLLRNAVLFLPTGSIQMLTFLVFQKFGFPWHYFTD